VKWRSASEQSQGFLKLGEKPELLPHSAFISLTRGEGLNLIQLFINQVLTMIVMTQLKKAPGLLYAELNGEFKNFKGNGQTMTVWDGKLMTQFRNKSKHSFAMKFFAWVIHRKNTKNWYLTYAAAGKIPNVLEAREILKEYGKFYNGGKLERNAKPPKSKQTVNS
jgi:hypothetical protein